MCIRDRAWRASKAAKHKLNPQPPLPAGSESGPFSGPIQPTSNLGNNPGDPHRSSSNDTHYRYIACTYNGYLAVTNIKAARQTCASLPLLRHASKEDWACQARSRVGGDAVVQCTKKLALGLAAGHGAHDSGMGSTAHHP